MLPDITRPFEDMFPTDLVRYAIHGHKQLAGDYLSSPNVSLNSSVSHPSGVVQVSVEKPPHRNVRIAQRTHCSFPYEQETRVRTRNSCLYRLECRRRLCMYVTQLRYVARVPSNQIAVAVLANILVRSPRKLVVNITRTDICGVFGVKMSRKYLEQLWKQNHWNRLEKKNRTTEPTMTSPHFRLFKRVLKRYSVLGEEPSVVITLLWYVINEVFLEYYHPKNTVFNVIENSIFQGDLSDISTETSTLTPGWISSDTQKSDWSSITGRT